MTKLHDAAAIAFSIGLGVGFGATPHFLPPQFDEPGPYKSTLSRKKQQERRKKNKNAKRARMRNRK